MNRIARTLTCLVTAGWIGAVACGRGSESPVAPTGESPTAKVQGAAEPATGAPRGGEIELTGSVEALDPPRLTVSGVQVVTDAATEIERGDVAIALKDLRIGESVKVEGTLQEGGVVHAREIEAGAVDPSPTPSPSPSPTPSPNPTPSPSPTPTPSPTPSPSPTPGVRVEFEGTIESLAPPTLRVAGRAVMTDSSTHLHGQGQTHSLSDFRVGDEVEIEGVLRPDGTVLADDIKRTEEAGHN